MTDDKIKEIAHRTASKYTHRSDPEFVAYTFLPHTLLDFARKLIDADRAGQQERKQATEEDVQRLLNKLFMPIPSRRQAEIVVREVLGVPAP